MTMPMDPRRRRKPGPPDGEPIVFGADEQSAVAVELEQLARPTRKSATPAIQILMAVNIARWDLSPWFGAGSMSRNGRGTG